MWISNRVSYRKGGQWSGASLGYLASLPLLSFASPISLCVEPWTIGLDCADDHIYSFSSLLPMAYPLWEEDSPRRPCFPVQEERGQGNEMGLARIPVKWLPHG